MDPRSEVMEIILEMGTFAKKALRLSMRALTQRDIGFFEQVEEAEKRTDELNIKIEEICYQQLRSKELSEEEFRFFSITPQISDRIERFADLATNINNVTKRGMPKPITIPLESLGFMSEISIEMLDLVTQAFYKGRSVSEEEFILKDNAIDDLNDELHGILVAYVHQNPETFDDAILLLNTAWFLERAGDVAAKIANRLIYIIEGRRVWIK